MDGRNKGIGEHVKEENSIAKSERSRNRRNSEEEGRTKSLKKISGAESWGSFMDEK